MQPEEQQRIMGYFIEEAKDHLNTIEQGLLNLQDTIEDAEKANEIFRAAHSVKGGAAMLGLESIQKTAHRMEDYFKILKESPVQVDRVLETMFLRISDGLKDLLEQLEGPFGLTQDKAQAIMTDVEPVFGQIEAHLASLVGQPSQTVEPAIAAGAAVDSPEAAKSRFKRDGASFLRKMLAAFKQPDNAESRKSIQDICVQLYEMGEQFNLSAWCDLIETARLAAGDSNNDYRALAPVLIKEIKQAQDLVLAGRASEIAVSDEMQTLLPEDLLENAIADDANGIEDFDLESSLEDSLHGLDFASDDLLDSESEEEFGQLFGEQSNDDDGSLKADSQASSKADVSDDSDELGELFGSVSPNESESLQTEDNDSMQSALGSEEESTESEDDIERLSLDLDFDEIPSELSTLNRDVESQEKADESLDALLATVNVTGPEVGQDELNSLADLFDGDLDELDNTLGSHAFATEEMQLHPEKIDLAPEDDLKDLLSGHPVEESVSSVEEEIEDDLFGGTLTDGEFAIADNTDDNTIEDLDDLPTDNLLDTDEGLSDDLIDLSKDPWEEESAELHHSADSLFESDLVTDSDTDLTESSIDGTDDLLGTAEIENAFQADETDLSDLEDLSLEDLSLEDLSSEEELIGEGIPNRTSVSVKPQEFSSHTVSPKEEEIEFPTLTGLELQEAEEDIDSFFLDEDIDELGINQQETEQSLKNEADETIEQISDDPWGELSEEDSTTDVADDTADASAVNESVNLAEGIPEDQEHREADPFLLEIEEDSPAQDFSDEDIAEDLETALLETESPLSFDIDLDVEQAGSELDDLLSEEGITDGDSEAAVEDSQSESLWDELLSETEGSASIEEEEDTLETESSDLTAQNALLDDELLETDFPKGSDSEAGNDELFDEVDLSSDFFEDSQSDNDDLETLSLEDLADDQDPEMDSKTESELTSVWAEENRASDIEEDKNLTEDSSFETVSEDFELADFSLDSSLIEEDIFAEPAFDEVEAESQENDKTQEIKNSELDDIDFAFNNEADQISEVEQLGESDAVEEIGSPLSSQQIAEGFETGDELPAPNETLDNHDGLELTKSSSTEGASQDIAGDELSEEVLADFETAFGTGIFSEVASEDMLSDTDSNDTGSTESSEQQANALTTDEPEASPLDISELEIDGLLDDGLEAELDGFLTEDELAEIDGSLPELNDYPIGDAAEITAQIRPVDKFKEEEDPAANDFDDLDALLSEESDEGEPENVGDLPTFVGDSPAVESAVESDLEDADFGDLERLLEDGPTEKASATAPSQNRSSQPPARPASSRRGGGIREQTMRVSVNHLDTLSNLVGELVVSRNTLERDQERLRQFLDNLLFQVQQLNDVGQRMRDLYERSLLESSLMSNRRAHDSARSAALNPQTEDPTSFFEDHATGETFDALEMDRFTGFHTLSQEMIELIVRVRESSSDIGYTVESSDQVTRQFRQITTQLQEGLNTARMVAFSQAADRLPRAVRDISLKCGKEARLIVEGQDTLIDKMIVEHLYDPLTHLVNNAITHGIEKPEKRRAAGKLPEGCITVRAFYQGNQTVIYVADDGGGINTDFVKQKAIEKKLITQAEAKDLSDIETYDLLFHPGFSTRDQADDFAGRGVGMDVVRTSLAEIRGTITIDSELGKGTSFTIKLPLTLSISKALSCVSNQARIAFPMDGVEDMLDVPRDRVVKNEDGQDCVRWRDTLLTFQPVTDLLKFNRTLGRGRVYGGSQEDDVLSIIVLRSANTYIAVQVDQVIGEQEIVIKQLEGPVPKPLGIAGATVLGDGRVMPIADVIELIDIAMGRVRREPASMLWAQDDAAEVEETPVKNDPTVLIVDDSITVRELLSMSFNKVGYRVEQARDGQEAWDKLRSGLPCDLVFCDIEMPRMDGLELLSRMQKDNHLKSIPIAMLTSRGADRHRQMAVDLGASGYFTKPYLEEALLDAAQRMLNGETLAKGRGG